MIQPNIPTPIFSLVACAGSDQISFPVFMNRSWEDDSYENWDKFKVNLQRTVSWCVVVRLFGYVINIIVFDFLTSLVKFLSEVVSSKLSSEGGPTASPVGMALSTRHSLCSAEETRNHNHSAGGGY